MKIFLFMAFMILTLLLVSWLLSLRFEHTQRFFYYPKYCMQRLFGFNDLYDKIADIFMSLESRTIYYTYMDKAWRLELWKGDYGLSFGGEIGLYYRDSSKDGYHYYCVSDKNMITMCFDLYHNESFVFAKEEALYWWANGFKFPYLKKMNPADLTMCASLTFQNFESRTAFVEAYVNTYGSETIQFSSDFADNTVKIVF